MPIKPDEKLIFVHVPKTGGSSIEKQLGLHPGDVEDNDYFLSGGKKQLQHLTLSQIIENKKDIYDLTDFTAIGMVRNPVDRMVSEFKWRRKIGHKIIDNLDINSFVKKIYDAKSQNVKLDTHFTEQSMFFSLKQGQTIKEIKIFKFEDGFENVGDFLSNYLNQPNIEIGKVNHTDSVKAPTELTEKSIQYIKEMFKNDYRAFYGDE